MKTLITLFAIVASFSMMAQSTATKSYTYHFTVINEQKAETTFIQIKQDVKDLVELSINEAGQAWTAFFKGNDIILTSGVEVNCTESTLAANKNFNFLGDAYPDIAPALDPMVTQVDSAPVASKNNFQFLGESFSELPTEEVIIPSGYRPASSIRFMGESFPALPVEEMTLPTSIL